MYGLNKKLRNCVPPPLEVDTEEFRKWKLLDCIPITKKEYYTYDEADAAISLAGEFENGLLTVGESTRIKAPSVESIGSTRDELGAVCIWPHLSTVSGQLLESTSSNRFSEEHGAVFIGPHLSAEGQTAVVTRPLFEPEKFDGDTTDELGAVCIGPYLSTVPGPLLDNEECVGSSTIESPTPTYRFAEPLLATAVIRPLLENEKSVGSTIDQMVHVEVKRPVGLVLQIEKDFQYDNLVQVIEAPEAYAYLLQTYKNTFARDAESFVETILYLTFEDNMLRKLAFRNYDGKINIEGSKFLECLIDAVQSKLKTGAVQAR